MDLAIYLQTIHLWNLTIFAHLGHENVFEGKLLYIFFRVYKQL